jgi:hypothetical protein
LRQAGNLPNYKKNYSESLKNYQWLGVSGSISITSSAFADDVDDDDDDDEIDRTH